MFRDENPAELITKEMAIRPSSDVQYLKVVKAHFIVTFDEFQHTWRHDGFFNGFHLAIDSDLFRFGNVSEGHGDGFTLREKDLWMVDVWYFI